MSTYIHGTAPEEQRRLSLLNDVLLNPASLREIALRGDERIVDFGSGLGQFSRAMARAVPRGNVVGIERSEEQLALAKRLAKDDGESSLVEFRQGDVLSAELEWGTYDIAHARFVLEHVPDPLRVVKTMVRAVRPGGRIILADDDHDVLRLWPEPPGMAELWRANMNTGIWCANLYARQLLEKNFPLEADFNFASALLNLRACRLKIENFTF